MLSRTILLEISIMISMHLWLLPTARVINRIFGKYIENKIGYVILRSL